MQVVGPGLGGCPEGMTTLHNSPCLSEVGTLPYGTPLSRAHQPGNCRSTALARLYLYLNSLVHGTVPCECTLWFRYEGAITIL